MYRLCAFITTTTVAVIGIGINRNKVNMIKGKCSNLLSNYHMLYGTAWKKDQTTELVLQAFEAGFRGIDTVITPIRGSNCPYFI